jgi:hypothetical protein
MPEIQISLTEKQFKEMLVEYNAKDEHRHRMTQSEVQLLAEKLNKKIDVPLISERKEGKILLKIILKIDKFLYDSLPNELYDLIRNLNDGIDDDEAKTLIKRLSKLANKKINIPYIPESLEYVMIRFVIALIVNAMRKKWNIEKAGDHSNEIEAKEHADDLDLENMIIPES